MSTVYRSWDHETESWCAIKVIHPEHAAVSKRRARFQGEADIMRLLEHPGVVRVLDVSLDDRFPYIVMELVDGGSLEDWLAAHGPMPPLLATSVLVDVCDAIQTAHEAGVVHRDIKPSNLLVTSDSRVKVTDFGIARLVDDPRQLTQTGSVMGTLAFMAPEQRASAKKSDARADIYSLGATLFTLATNRTSMDLFAAELDDELLAGVDPSLAEVVIRACSYQPNQRHRTCAELKEELRSIEQNLPAIPMDTPPLVLPKRAPPPPPPRPERFATPRLQVNDSTWRADTPTPLPYITLDEPPPKAPSGDFEYVQFDGPPAYAPPPMPALQPSLSGDPSSSTAPTASREREPERPPSTESPRPSVDRERVARIDQMLSGTVDHTGASWDRPRSSGGLRPLDDATGESVIEPDTENVRSEPRRRRSEAATRWAMLGALLVALAAVVGVVGWLGSLEVNDAASRANAKAEALHALLDDAPTVATELARMGADRGKLDAALAAYRNAEPGPNRTAAGRTLIRQLRLHFASLPPIEESSAKERQGVRVELVAMERAESELGAAEDDWDHAMASFEGMTAVLLGLAPGR